MLDSHDHQEDAQCARRFKAVENAKVGSKSQDVTGIVAISCARHGCVAPRSVADLDKGEQQKNVDFAFLEALKTTNVDGIPQVVLLYDIACQYCIHFMERNTGKLPDRTKFDRAVGVFHLRGHNRECGNNYSPVFILGIGIVSGEILETVWAVLNAVSPSVCTASQATRVELLDNHLSDMNWRKILATGE